MQLIQSKKFESNYYAKLVNIKTFTKHPNPEVTKLKVAHVDGYNIIVGIDEQPGLYVYFPMMSEINPNILNYCNLYDNLCHAILIMQTLKTLDKSTPEYKAIKQKKQETLAALMKQICHSIGTREILLDTLNQLLELNSHNPQAKNLVLTLFETLDEKPKKKH